MPENLPTNVKRTSFGMVRFLFSLAVYGIILGLIFLMIVGDRPLSTDPDAATKIIRIAQGMNATQITNLLDEEGLILNSTLFRIVLKMERAEQSMQAGTYLLGPQMTPLEIIENLRSGRVQMQKAMIPEGFEIKQIAKALSQEELVDEQRFLELAYDANLVFGEDLPLDLPIASLEGYLYPDTYYFYEGQTEEDIIIQMVNRFLEVTRTQVTPLLEESALSLHELVTLASIVEREVMVAHERPIVASVYLNRLAIDMPLQADPTVRYVTTEERPQVLYRDLEIDSPYNTYRNRGLPPGPIASPGLASMLAVLNPAETDYYFFVSRRDGTHEFTRTYDDHLQARRTLGY